MEGWKVRDVAEEADIVSRAAGGDAEAFGEIVQRHGRMVSAVCRDVLGDEHEALDASQDTFVRVYQKLSQVQDARRLRAWLRSVAHSVCVNRVKGRARSRCGESGVEGAAGAEEIADTADGPDRQAEVRELAQAVPVGMARLPEKYRRAIEMFYFEEASGREIAQRLGLREGAVRTRLSRVRQMLRPHLAGHWPIEVLSRSKQARGWVPKGLCPEESAGMKLEYDKTTSRLLRGDAEVTIRPMQWEDLPAMRKYDQELTATLAEDNANRPPDGISNNAGGPWSDDQWLRDHFQRYEDHGGLTLLAEEDSGRIVGFADLWPTDEPEPFGRSLDVECQDYFREYYLAGLETILLAEAEKVARAAGLPNLDVGTNTCSGEYTSLRRFGLKVIYEYDHVQCHCQPTAGSRASKCMRTPADADLNGLVRASHWSPTDFTFRPACQNFDGDQYIAELTWPGKRAILELWRYEKGRDDLSVPENPPNKSELYVEPAALTLAEAFTDILAECAALAGEAGAQDIQLPCPSEIELPAGRLEVLDRQFAFPWLRKRL